MGKITISIEYQDNGLDKKEEIKTDFDENINQELFCQWYNKTNGGYAVEGVGGRPNDRRKK